MSYYDNDYSDDMYDRYMHTGEGAEYFEEESPCEYIPPRRRYYKVNSGKHSNDELDEIIRRLKQQKKEERRAKKHRKRQHSNEIYAKDQTERKVLQADVLFSCW